MKLAPHYLKRYKDIALLLLRYGQNGLGSRFGLGELEVEAADGQAQADAERLPNDLERLGPTFVKLGQLLSSRPDLIPERYVKALSRLQDRVKPFPFHEVEEIIETELGARINKVFCEFDPEPLAAASLGQVHSALLHDGRAVVVKVQRPNITREVEADFAALEEIARFLDEHTAAGQRYQLPQIVEEFERTLAHELDYQREAANMEALAKSLAGFEHIRVPRAVEGFTTRRVLTMERIDGTKITELSPLARLDFDGHLLAEELFRAYLQQILVDGTFHADPHPGNILLTDENKIGLLDLGMVGHTSPAMREHLLQLLLAVSEGDSDEATAVALRIGQPRPAFDQGLFRQRLTQLVADQQNSTLRRIDVGRVILDVSRSAADSHLLVPTELSLLGKTLLQLDQVGRVLEPEFDPNESVRRNASHILNQRLKSTFSEGKMFAALLEAKQFLGTLPNRLNKILETIGNAELKVTVKPSETEFLVESARKVANRITTGLVLAALIVGAALLMRVQTSFQIFGYPGLAMICFLAAAGGGFWFVLSTLWQDHKTRRKVRK